MTLLVLSSSFLGRLRYLQNIHPVSRACSIALKGLPLNRVTVACMQKSSFQRQWPVQMVVGQWSPSTEGVQAQQASLLLGDPHLAIGVITPDTVPENFVLGDTFH